MSVASPSLTDCIPFNVGIRSGYSNRTNDASSFKRTFVLRRHLRRVGRAGNATRPELFALKVIFTTSRVQSRSAVAILHLLHGIPQYLVGIPKSFALPCSRNISPIRMRSIGKAI
jgi:hypothetical protein